MAQLGSYDHNTQPIESDLHKADTETELYNRLIAIRDSLSVGNWTRYMVNKLIQDRWGS
jgi:hypothetical protein